MAMTTVRRKASRGACAGIAALLIASHCTAAQVESVQVGDVYTLWRVSSNLRVQVRQVDRAASMVKVAHANGDVEWVPAARLLTKAEAAQADVSLGFILLGATVCLLTDACKNKR